MPTFDAFLAAQHDRFIDDLKSFVAQPSVAATGQGMIEMAALVQQRLEQIGATVRQIPTGGAPIVYAETGQRSAHVADLQPLRRAAARPDRSVDNSAV